MIEPLDVQAELSRRLYMLSPRAFKQRCAELYRGGLPSRSMSDGPRGGEAPIPVMQPVTRRDENGVPVAWGTISPSDAFDRRLRKLQKVYADCFAEALRMLDRAYQAQTEVMAVAERIPDRRPYCSNLRCDKELEEGRNSGECGRCRQHRHKHGLPYPMVPAE